MISFSFGVVSSCAGGSLTAAGSTGSSIDVSTLDSYFYFKFDFDVIENFKAKIYIFIGKI
jgi:hypothetical protein